MLAVMIYVVLIVNACITACITELNLFGLFHSPLDLCCYSA